MGNRDMSPLKEFAFLGGAAFLDKLIYLSKIAEKENWYYDSPSAQTEQQKKYGVLFQYIHHTFSRAADEGKVLETDKYAVFNTGLLTLNGEEIYALFHLNRYETPKWFLDSFYPVSSRYIPSELVDRLPAYVDYFSNRPEDAYFDTMKSIRIYVDHVMERFDRFPPIIQAIPRDVLIMLINSAEITMKKKILRNNRLVVPQYYNKQIAYLAPLNLAGQLIPLAIEKEESTYRVNTVLTPGMAYCNARLIMKPESNWLTNEMPGKNTAKSIQEESLFI